MTYKLMIFYDVIPDVAMIQDKRGIQVPGGTIEGKGCMVPVVCCPDSTKGDRTALQTCLNCKNCARLDHYFVTCNFVPKSVANSAGRASTFQSVEERKDAPAAAAPAPAEVKPVVKERKLPEGVFTDKK